MNDYNTINALTEKLEKENPGKTIVLDGETLKPVIISDNPKAIRAAVVEMGDRVPIFIGGPYNGGKDFHLICDNNL